MTIEEMCSKLDELSDVMARQKAILAKLSMSLGMDSGLQDIFYVLEDFYEELNYDDTMHTLNAVNMVLETLLYKINKGVEL